MRISLFAPLMAAMIATPALAQTAAPAAALPTGIVDDPCAGQPAFPPEVEAYRQALYGHPAGAKPVVPVEAMTKFRTAFDAWKPKDWAALCYYRADNIRLEALPADPRRVVFMGDSITEGWKIAHPEFFDAQHRIDRGISGQTTPQMLVRFEADVIALHPAAVHIMAGTNDLAGNTGPSRMQDVKNNIMAMVQLAKANHIRVLLASIPPTINFVWAPALKPGPQLAELNAWLRRYAKEQGATYVDYHAVLSQPDGAMQKDLTFDGVHPNPNGYTRMEPVALAALGRR